jgi:hypothetical protein
VPEGHGSNWASGKCQLFIWVEVSMSNSEKTILKKELAEKPEYSAYGGKGNFRRFE